MTSSADTKIRALLLANAAEAHSSPLAQESEPPCTKCGCALPAAEPGECLWPDECPLEGKGRD